MKNKTRIQFDELDLKCLNEMPLILDVMSSTGNKITRLITPLYSEMNELIKMNLKPNWQVGKKSSECQIYPFTYEEDTKIKITMLETSIKIESAMQVSKILKGKEVNFFWAFFGYNCYTSEDENINRFYFMLGKGDVRERLGGTINSLQFYNQIKNKLKDYNIDITHPEKGDDAEFIELIVDQFSIDKIHDGFETFKQSILAPFLKSIK